MRKVYNFSSGPAMLAEEVLLKAQSELLDWHDTGMSIMELGHRGSDYKTMVDKTEADLRELMSIPKNYHVLFLAGGATAQFSMVPLNLFSRNKTADYIDTGIWSKKAIAEAKRFGTVHIGAESKVENGINRIPLQNEWHLNPDASYVHYTTNETIEGLEFHWVPKTGDIPLVADMSSNILSKPIRVADYGIIYAGAQKNIGQAGISVVIIREDLVVPPLQHTPILYSYKTEVENNSMYNTPPTFAWYIAGLTFEWMKSLGGVAYFAELNRRKANKLYLFIDEHKDFYINNVHPDSRSLMNIPFNIVNKDLTDTFLSKAKEAGLTNLKGHRLVGGVRASIYNSMPEEGVDALIEFMKDFAKLYG